MRFFRIYSEVWATKRSGVLKKVEQVRRLGVARRASRIPLLREKRANDEYITAELAIAWVLEQREGIGDVGVRRTRVKRSRRRQVRERRQVV